MNGDFSSLKFTHPDYQKKKYKRVHFLQGKVQIDSDLNELTQTLIRNEERNLRNIIGSAGTPQEDGFKISLSQNNNFKINAGQYYVNGFLVENEESVNADGQRFLPLLRNKPKHPSLPTEAGYYIVYLDVFEQYVTFLDDPDLLEPALGGVDTTARSRNVWQVKLLKVSDGPISCEEAGKASQWLSLINQTKGTLQVRTRTTDTMPRCAGLNANSYLGNENQLYRIEVCNAGAPNNNATFVWSRNNASVVANITEISGTTISVSSTGRDKLLGFLSNQWAEITDDYHELHGIAGTLVKIKTIDNDYQISFDINSDKDHLVNSNSYPISQNPKIIGWDMENESGPIKIVRNNEVNEGFIPLENGIEVRFSLEGYYPSSAYWTFTARSINGLIDWPVVENVPKPLLPEGIDHWYAMLAIIKADAAGNIELVHDCRQKFKSLVETSEKATSPLSISPAIWVHGNTVTTQYPEKKLSGDRKIAEFRRGIGTSYVQSSGDNWFHFPFAIFSNNPERVTKLKRVIVLYNTFGNTLIKDVYVYDGPKIIATFTNLNLSGKHDEAIDGSNFWILDQPIAINFGLNISVHVEFMGSVVDPPAGPFEPNLPTTGTNTTINPNLPTTGTNTTINPNLPTTGTNTTINPNLPTTGTNTTINPNLPTTGTNTTINPNLPTTGTNTTINPNLPTTGTNTTINPNLPTTGTNTTINPNLPTTGTNTTINPNLPTTGTNTTINHNRPLTHGGGIGFNRPLLTGTAIGSGIARDSINIPSIPINRNERAAGAIDTISRRTDTTSFTLTKQPILITDPLILRFMPRVFFAGACVEFDVQTQ